MSVLVRRVGGDYVVCMVTANVVGDLVCDDLRCYADPDVAFNLADRINAHLARAPREERYGRVREALRVWTSERSGGAA